MTISPERAMKRKLKGMNTLDLRIRIKQLLDTGLITEEEYKMLLYVYVKDLYIENACMRLGMSESTFYYHWKSLITKLMYIF